MQFSPYRASNTHRPLFYLGDIPMDATNILVGLHIATALVFTFATGWFAATWASELTYSAQALKGLRVWTLVTYPFVHGIDLWFAVSLYFFWRFGGDVENLLGTEKFVRLYLALTVIPPLGLFAFSPIIGELPLASEGPVHFAIFVSFALIHPNAAMWFNIPVKWFVALIVVVNTLQYLGLKSWENLAALWLSILTAFYILNKEGVRSCAAITSWIRAKLRLSPSTEVSRHPAKPRPAPPLSRDKRIDAILDKISESGFQSLTEEEKAILNERSDLYNNRRRR